MQFNYDFVLNFLQLRLKVMKQIPSYIVTSWVCLSCGLGDAFLMHTFSLVISKHEHIMAHMLVLEDDSDSAGQEILFVS